ncbi:MAG: hypothetical protein DI535_17575 [Citrobacter freundii]|nr:MAG: hypothetical protein DI535_17575 [Citrobacter freundii]
MLQKFEIFPNAVATSGTYGTSGTSETSETFPPNLEAQLLLPDIEVVLTHSQTGEEVHRTGPG